MISVRPVPEPGTFDGEVRKKGNIWLQANPNSTGRPPAYWKEFTPALKRGFNGLCGYAAMIDFTDGTVDHFLSWKNRKDLAYEWSNYRFATSTMNSSKKNADDSILDPYEVGDGWFEIQLPSLQLIITDAVPNDLRKKANYTLKRMKLRDGEQVIRWRQSWYDMYTAGKLTLEGLKEVAPLIAMAVERAITKPRK